jgi:hypothetical protein
MCFRSLGNDIVYAAVVGLRYFVIPPPYCIEVVCCGAEHVLDGCFGICDAGPDGIDEVFDVPCDGEGIDAFIMPVGMDVQTGAMQADLELKYRLRL